MNEIQLTYFRFFDIFIYLVCVYFTSENVSAIRNAQVAVILLVNDIFHIGIKYNKRIKQAVLSTVSTSTGFSLIGYSTVDFFDFSRMTFRI